MHHFLEERAGGARAGTEQAARAGERPSAGGP